MLFQSPLGRQPLASTGRAERTAPELQMNWRQWQPSEACRAALGVSIRDTRSPASPQGNSRQHPQRGREAALTLSRECVSLHVQTSKVLFDGLIFKMYPVRLTCRF